MPLCLQQSGDIKAVHDPKCQEGVCARTIRQGWWECGQEQSFWGQSHVPLTQECERSMPEGTGIAILIMTMVLLLIAECRSYRLWVHCHRNVTGSRWQMPRATYTRRERTLKALFVQFPGQSSKNGVEAGKREKRVCSSTLLCKATIRVQSKPACRFKVGSETSAITLGGDGHGSGEMDRREKSGACMRVC